MTTINSRDNRYIKTATAARERRADGLFLAEGVRLIADLIASTTEIEFVFVTESFADTPQGSDMIDEFFIRGIEIFFVNEKLLAHVADTRSPQGVVAVCREETSTVDDIWRSIEGVGKIPLVAVLNEVSDPSNLGSVIRSAEAAGIAAIVLTERSADPFSPKSVRASMGSLFRMPVVRGAKVNELIDGAKSAGFVTVGAAVDGATDHFSFDWQPKTLLFLGSEAHGLPDDVLGRLDATVKIEMADSIESLNLAVSAGLLFFEAKRKMAG